MAKQLSRKPDSRKMSPVSAREATALFYRHIRLAFKVLGRFCQRTGTHPDDFEAAAMAGLWHACRWHEPSLGFRFSTYAWKCIKGAMQTERADLSGWRRSRREWTNVDDGFLESVPDHRADHHRENEAAADVAGRLLKTRPYREREVIKLRHGIGHDSTHTLEETARIFRVTRERVRQIEARAIRRMRDGADKRTVEAALSALEEDEHSYNTPPPPVVRLGDETNPWMENAIRAWEDASASVGL